MTNLLPVVAISQHGGALGWATGGACTCAAAFAGLRWLRVAQREHYLPDSASRFALRWWSTTAVNRIGALLGLAGLVLTARGGCRARHGRGGGARSGGSAAERPHLAASLDTPSPYARRRLGGAPGRGRTGGVPHRLCGRRVRGRCPGGPGTGRRRLHRDLAARAAPGGRVRGARDRTTTTGEAEGGGRHRLLREDEHQGVHSALVVGVDSRRCEPGQLQQPRRARAR